MEFKTLRSDRSMFDLHEPSTPPKKIDAEIVLIELTSNFSPKAYLCPSDSHHGNTSGQFILLGDVREFERGHKTIFLEDGTTIFYNSLVIVSKTESGRNKEDEFHKALQSLLEAIRVNEKVEIMDKMASLPLENIRKLRAMIKPSEEHNESLDAIKNSNKQTSIREPHNRLFELHL